MQDDNAIINEIHESTRALRTYRAKRHIDGFQEYFSELRDYIRNTISLWVGYTFIGVRKESKIESAFQYFYIEFMGLLLDIHNNHINATPEELSFADSTLYKGDIYRYLGSSDCLKPAKGIISVKYNHIYVSWSKDSKLNHNMDEKLYGDKTLLIGNTGKEYGIDLQDLGGRPFEKEIVFPTPKAAVKRIELIK